VIDLNFPGLMSPGELRSLCQQLSYAYSAAVHVHGSAGRSGQLHLHLLGVGGELQAVLDRQLPGHVHWAATKSELSYREFFKVGVCGRVGGAGQWTEECGERVCVHAGVSCAKH
jgi:hypothetical protein